MTLEEAQSKILELEEKINDYENLKVELENKEERIKSLEEHNQKLFLRATSSLKVEEPKEEFKSDLLGDYAKLLSDEEIELLKELEE